MARQMKDSGIEWIGMIPGDWEIKKIKQILIERKEKNEPIKTNEILSLSIDKGIFPYSEKTGGGNKAKEDLTAYKLAYPNDIVLNSMNVIVGAVGLSNYFGCVSPVYYTLYPRTGEFDVNYYANIFQSSAFQKSLMGYGNGIMMKESNNGKLNTIRMRIPMEKLNTVGMPVPPLSEQQKIADFLDEKVTEIDTAIEKTKSTIEDYKKYKQSVITEAVTKGLNPDVEMKDSGIEWIGMIPKDWDINMLSQIFLQLKNKNKDLTETNLLSLSYGKIKRKNIDSAEGLLPESFENYNIIDKNDIVLRLTDLQNDHKSLRVGYATEKGIITSAYVTLTSRSKINTKFYYYYLHTFDIHKGFYGMGSGVRQGLNYEELKKLKIVTPDVIEQEEIVDYLDEICTEIDNLIASKEAIIEELQTYKKSLIYEYVTGKKEVE